MLAAWGAHRSSREDIYLSFGKSSHSWGSRGSAEFGRSDIFPVILRHGGQVHDDGEVHALWSRYVLHARGQRWGRSELIVIFPPIFRSFSYGGLIYLHETSIWLTVRVQLLSILLGIRYSMYLMD